METKTLKVKALDNHGHKYPVELRFERESCGLSRLPDGTMGKHRTNKWVLHITTTPGHWYMSTLLEEDRHGRTMGKVISIDFGQNWNCINFDEVMKEAKEQI